MNLSIWDRLRLKLHILVYNSNNNFKRKSNQVEVTRAARNEEIIYIYEASRRRKIERKIERLVCVVWCGVVC